MEKFIINFSGYCEINAETHEEAEEKFWALIGDDKPLPSNLYELESCISETEEQAEFDRQREIYESFWDSPAYNPRKEI